MKNFLIICLFFIVLFSACDECSDTDCPWDKAIVRFQPVNINGEFLLLMPDSIYNNDSIHLITPTTNIELSFDPPEIILILNQSVKEFIIDFSKNKKDTFNIDINMKDNKCCGKVFDYYSLSNQDTVLCEACFTDSSFKVVVP